MSAFSAAASDEDGDIISALREKLGRAHALCRIRSDRIRELEAMLYAVGAGGVGKVEQPQCVDWPEVDRLLKTVKYLIGIAERGSGRKMRNDDETVEQFVLSYVRSLEQPQGEQEPLFWYRPRSDGMYEGPLHKSQIERVRKESGGWVPLYTHPQPPRQPLTNSQINRLVADGEIPLSGNPYEVTRAIERAHKIGGEA